MKEFLEYLGVAILIMSLAVSCEFCDRPDKDQSLYQWIGACHCSVER